MFLLVWLSHDMTYMLNLDLFNGYNIIFFLDMKNNKESIDLDHDRNMWKNIGFL